MSRDQFNQFIKKVITETPSEATNPTGVGADLAKAFSELKDRSGEEKVQGVITKLAAFAKSQGYDVTEADVKGHIDGLKEQYDLNPMIASMMDNYCSTTCHIGSAVGSA